MVERGLERGVPVGGGAGQPDMPKQIACLFEAPQNEQSEARQFMHILRRAAAIGS